MDLKQLEYFSRVAELGSFTRAAYILGIAQPALSRQVRLLEVELRQALLLRNGRGVTTTEAGKLLLEHCRGILHQVALAREELGSVRGALAGHVSIGLPPSLSKLIAVPLAKAFRARLPQAQLTLTEGFSVPMVEGLRAGRMDIALLYNPTPAPDLEISVLHEEALVLISAKGTPKASKTSIALVAVAALPLIVPSRPNAFRILIDSEMMRSGCKPDITLEIDGLNAILDLVKEGLGHAVLPAYTVRNFASPHPFTTRSIVQPRLLSQLALVGSARRPATETHREAMRITREVVLGAIQGRMALRQPTTPETP
jgi:LysR family transcriptional regulator, nitrogen assimilation regulatory protein